MEPERLGTVVGQRQADADPGRDQGEEGQSLGRRIPQCAVQSEQAQRHQHEAQHGQDMGSNPGVGSEGRRSLQRCLVRIWAYRRIEDEEHAGDHESQRSETNPRCCHRTIPHVPAQILSLLWRVL
jgi:hypothetical protein